MREPEQQQNKGDIQSLRLRALIMPSAEGKKAREARGQVLFALGLGLPFFRVGRLRRLFGWRGGWICCGVWVCNCLCGVVFCRERARNRASWGSCGRVFSRSPWFVRG